MVETNAEGEIYFFLETINRENHQRNPQYSGCYSSYDGIQNVMNLAIANGHRIHVSLIKVWIRSLKVISYMQNSDPEATIIDPIDLFNSEAFFDLQNFILKYPDKNDFHILEVQHHIC